MFQINLKYCDLKSLLSYNQGQTHLWDLGIQKKKKATYMVTQVSNPVVWITIVSLYLYFMNYILAEGDLQQLFSCFSLWKSCGLKNNTSSLRLMIG